VHGSTLGQNNVVSHTGYRMKRRGRRSAWWNWLRGSSSSREQLLVDSLSAIVDRDYELAATIAGQLEQRSETASLSREAAFIVGRVARITAGLHAAELEEYQARRELENLLSSLDDAVLVVDAETRIRFLNSRAARLFEISVQHALGATALEALPSLSLGNEITAALLESRSSAAELPLYNPRREMFVRVAPLRSSFGQVYGAVVIMQDLTELRRLERVRRDFVSNASHELRTPVANIRAASETLLSTPEDSALAARFLPQIVDQAERLTRLVDDLLNLAQAEHAVDQIDEPIDLRAIVWQVVEGLLEKAARQQVTIRLDGSQVSISNLDNHSGEPVIVPGNAGGLEQVVFNLLDNALTYTPAGGSVDLAVQAGVDPPSDAGRVCVLTVSDTGIGIPADDLPRIFERFYRADKARSRAHGGTGLGLAIVKHLVENHQGHIEVQSSPAAGTTFTVTLPAPETDPSPVLS